MNNNLSQKDTIFIKACLNKFYPESKFLNQNTFDAILEKKELKKVSGGHNLDFSTIAQDVLNMVETLSTIITLYLALKDSKKEEVVITIKAELDKNEVFELMDEEEKEELTEEIYQHIKNNNEG